ncbi:putative defensin-like protein 20 [Durio zibethinus]|uniref:Defensin-like protein 20 n=1 Tax=Durio zibethinus TaxID=66656 RepID=A0A6P6A511_DURZI|nr:putative defensin-like protein 20 [Durio zibethinus]
MAQTKFLSFVLLAVLILSIDVMEVVGGDKCCKDHPSLGECIPGVDDDPENNGKCWAFCIKDCVKGGFCEQIDSAGHFVCHCYC